MADAPIYLLDANVLIALATSDHTLHARARGWFSPGTRFATCPVTQGALLRFQMRFAPRPSVLAAKRLLSRICAISTHEFWPDTATYLDIPEAGVIGQRQITDAYLIALARAHRGVLATMDEALAAVRNDAILI